jgi:hypothetical protein
MPALETTLIKDGNAAVAAGDYLQQKLAEFAHILDPSASFQDSRHAASRRDRCIAPGSTCAIMRVTRQYRLNDGWPAIEILPGNASRPRNPASVMAIATKVA